MRRTRRFPTRLVRCISLCVSLALVLSFLAIVPVQRNGTSFAQGQGSPNGQGTRVPAPPPVVGPPAADLPNIDAVRRRQHDPPQTPPYLPSMIRSRRNPIEPRNGRRVGDPGTTTGAIGASERKNSNAKDAEYLAKGAQRNTLRASANAFATSALNFSSSVARGRSKLNHARITSSRSRSGAGTSARSKLYRTNASPSPIGDDQYVQNFFQYALNRQPSTTGTNELSYWADILRAAYTKGQTSMVMAARELGKTLFESSEYVARARNDHWYVYDLYKTYLLRDPDPGGWAYWEAAVPSIGREATRRAFDECGEFIYWVGTVTPNGSASSAVSSLISGRVDPNNQPGDQLLARDCEWGVSLLGLPGRAGLDLGLGLSYSSLVWTRSGPYMYFDEDNGWPSPGFRLGFATIQEKFFDAQSGANMYLLIGSSGGRVELRQVGTSNVYEAADSSYLQLTDNSTSLLLRTTDGTQMSYSKFENEWRCTQIKDSNGNFITVNYDWHGHITNITDTLARVVTFNYDVNANPISITQTWNGQTHTWATFGWGTVTIQTSFSGVAVVGAPNGTVVPVLNMVGFDDQTYSKFLYNAYGQVTRITSYASDSSPITDNHPRSYTAYDYGASDDVTRIIATRVWAENWSGLNGVPSEVVTQFSLPGDGSHQLTAPDGTIYKDSYGTGWQKGLTTQTEVWSGGVQQKLTTISYTQDNTSVSYQTNPRVTETNVYDAAGKRRRTTISYTTFTLPSGASCSLPSDGYEYQADAATVLRRSHNDYRYDSIFLSRHIVGLPAGNYIYDGSGVLYAKTIYDYDWPQWPEHLQATPAPATQHDETNFGPGTAAGRGNLVLVQRWDATDPNNYSKVTESKLGYFTTGAVAFQRDALGHQSNLSYTDAFSDNINRNTFAYPTTLTDADGYSSYLQYNYDFGAKTRTQGPPPAGQSQGVIQTFTYDSAARLQRVTTTNNGAYTRFVYGPTYVQSYATVNAVADDSYSIQTFDGAGRVIGAAANHPGSTGGYRAQLTVYNLLGQGIKQSNPTEVNAGWSPTGDDAAGWVYTQQSYDWKGRPLLTTNTDGTQKSASYSACGCAGSEVTTLTDEMGRRQKVYSDVLGRTAKTEILNLNGTIYSTTANTFNARDQLTRQRQFQGTAPTDPNDQSCPSTTVTTALGTDTSWKQTLTYSSGWQNANFNDSSWSPAVDEGAYGTSPWGTTPIMPAGTPAHWIWYYDSRNSSDTATVYFRKTFVASTSSVTLTMTADNRFDGYLDGILVIGGYDWTLPSTVTLPLIPGKTYVLAVSVQNTGGSGGLLAHFGFTSFADGSCQQSTMTYDGFGRLQTRHLPKQQVDPDNSSSTDHTTWDYNNDDTIQKVTDARGASATYSYNNRHLVTGITYNAPAGITAAPSVTYSYDAAGNRTAMTDGLGSKSYAYNQLSQMTSEVRTINGLTGSYTLSYQYNLGGELKKITDPTGVSIAYSFDQAGRITSVNGADILYTGVSNYASSLQYRAWGTIKGMSYGSGQSLSVSYNNRLQIQNWTINGPLHQYAQSPAGKQIVHQYYPDGRQKYSHDLLAEFFDRANSYDHAGALKEAYTGSEARDFINGTNTNPGAAPYRQTYYYDAWDNLASRENRYWSLSDSYGATYNSSNRNTSWQYDADGNVLGDESLGYTFDAAGRNIRADNSLGTHTITVGLDGDGELVKRVIDHHNDPPIPNSVTTTYYLRSSILGGNIITELNGNGQKQTSNVYLGQEVLARQLGADSPYPQNMGVIWRHEDPVTGARGTSSSYGYAADLQPDPLGVDVGFNDPYTAPPEPEPQPDFVALLGGSNGSSSCRLDGAEIDCATARRLASSGLATQCPNDECSRYNPNLRNGLGGFEDFSAYADGFMGYLPPGSTYLGNGRALAPYPVHPNSDPNDELYELSGIVMLQPIGYTLPQDPKMQGPYEGEGDPDMLMGKGNSGNCNIYVNFKPGTSYPGPFSGKPNGPSTVPYRGYITYGLGFTVAGTVKGGIGKIGEDSNGQNPNGRWTMDQWTSSYIEEGHHEVHNDHGKGRRDISSSITYWAPGDSFVWYDHPGSKAAANVTLRRQNFTVSVSNGIERCYVSFHFIQTGNVIHWGPGPLP